MEQNLVVLQGKIFSVDIPSMIGSTNYRWCLKKLPEDMMLIWTEDCPGRGAGVRQGIQKFYFCAVTAGNTDADIPFELCPLSDLSKAADTYTAKIHIVPHDSSEFVACNETAGMKYGYYCGMEDASKAMPPYGFWQGGGSQTNLPFMTDASKAAVPYGFWSGGASNNMYGYPQFNDDSCRLMYGCPNCW